VDVAAQVVDMAGPDPVVVLAATGVDMRTVHIEIAARADPVGRLVIGALEAGDGVDEALVVAGQDRAEVRDRAQRGPPGLVVGARRRGGAVGFAERVSRIDIWN